jgi:hypothetical protein
MTKEISILEWMKLYYQPTVAESDCELRKRIRHSETPACQLPDDIDRLLAKIEPSLRLKLAVRVFTIDLQCVYPRDVIDGLISRFEKAGWLVWYDYRDYAQVHDSLIFQPPADWLHRLLKVGGTLAGADPCLRPNL